MVGNKGKGRISKRVLQEKKQANISEKKKFPTPDTHTRRHEMFILRKILRALFSCDTRFKIADGTEYKL